MADQTVRDLKLVQYLNEAYGKEKELETALQAHIGMTTKAPYKKRLQQHLKETKAHARQVERRIKQLGGKAESVAAPGPIGDAASAVTSVAGKAVSAAKGPLHAIRGTGENEKMLKNAKTRVLERARGDRDVHRDRDARRHGWRQGHRQARPGDPARGGADGEVPRRPDPDADEGRGAGGDPGGRAERRRDARRRRRTVEPLAAGVEVAGQGGFRAVLGFAVAEPAVLGLAVALVLVAHAVVERVPVLRLAFVPRA